MEVKKLQQYIGEYRQLLERMRHFERTVPWEVQHAFQKNWDIEAPDFGAMYDQSLQSQQTKRMWKRENYEPKAMMLRFIEQQPDFVRQMFRNLFNEEKDIENRIARFKFCCDEMLSEYKANHPVSIDNNHYHEDNQMIFYYLSFRYPEAYTLFDYLHFKNAMANLGTRNLPGPHDLLRFVKISKTIYKFLLKEEALPASLQRHLAPDWQYLSGSALMVQDFFNFISIKG